MYKVKRFSKMEDEDFLEELEKDSKDYRSSLKIGGAVTGGLILGATGGALTKSSTGALVGAGLGAYGGYKLGKDKADEVRQEYKSRMAKYRKASQYDKRYMRDRYRRDKENLDRNAAIANAGINAGILASTL